MKTAIARLAGIIEVKACFGIHKFGQKEKRRPSIKVRTHSETLAISLQEHFGGSVFKVKSSREEWQWQVTFRSCLKTLKIIRPYLTSKSDLADQMIESYGYMGSKKYEYKPTEERKCEELAFGEYRRAVHRARTIYTAARQKGEIKKEPCEKCGDPNSQGHHENYLEPLKVRWLCSKHHGEEHRGKPRFIGPA